MKRIVSFPHVNTVQHKCFLLLVVGAPSKGFALKREEQLTLEKAAAAPVWQAASPFLLTSVEKIMDISRVCLSLGQGARCLACL